MYQYAKTVFHLMMFLIFGLVLAPIQSGASPGKGGDFFSIQIHAFRDHERAADSVKDLKKSGHEAFFRLEEVRGKEEWYRVYIGRFENRGEAVEAAKRLKDRGLIPGSFMVRSLREIPGAGSEKVNVKSPVEGKVNETGPEAGMEVKRKAAPDTGKKTELPLIIKDITFRPDKDGKESVFVHSNRFFEPLVFALEGDRPRFVIDVRNTSEFRKDLSMIPVEGRLIEKIRTHHHRGTGTLRVVLDLYPSVEYQINQLYFKAQDIYALVVESRRRAETERVVEPSGGEEAGRLVHGSEERMETETLFRTMGEDVSGERMRLIIREHDFFSSCWNFNSDFCNPNGDFENFFIDNDNGTVTDLVTRLMWQKGGSPGEMTWKEAWEYILELNNRNFAGYSDWRLPTTEELGTLIECSWKNGELFIETAFEGGQRNCWSADSRGDERAWKVNFHLGHIADSPVNYRNSVRAVRSEKAVPYR